QRHRLGGFVRNGPAGVVIEVQGPASGVEAFAAALRDELPPLAEVTQIDIEEWPLDPAQPAAFTILESEADASPAGAAASVPPDVATCAACLTELRDPASRRFRYPFTNCTDCGPRFTIIQSLPYDRPRTTMVAFPLCQACAAEYADPADRRFHAQPNACPACGPSVWFTTGHDPGGIAIARADGGCSGDAAIEAARERLRAGDVLAVKSLGGFHLVCDATSDAAVGRLRARKQRVAKPLAVMVADMDVARRCTDVSEQERLLLESPARPIVLVAKRADGGGLAEGVAPGNDFIGLMLPALPLQHLLCEQMPPLVMTSGNLAEEPIACENAEAAARLAGLVDGFLMHDRGIETACDDSVIRCVAGAPLPIRRSRGYAPLPIRLGRPGPVVLAVGGELKATLCITRDDQAIMSQHIGDMGNLETLDALGRAADHLLRLYEITPAAVACDMHPGYLSADWARRFAADRGIPLVPVQHHEAHVSSLLADHAALEMPLIGVCFDGTGYGRDGTIWGGEVFLASQGVAAPMMRAAYLEPFALPGGDAAIRHPWRVALALLHGARLEWDPRLPSVGAASDEAARVLRQQLESGLNCTASTSMGRLFDAVASLAGVKQSIGYEAEAAMNLEALAAVSHENGSYPLWVLDGDPLRIDWRPAVAGIVGDVLGGVATATIAARFHAGVAAAITDVCMHLRSTAGIDTVGLTGGVFQNATLVQLTVKALQSARFDVLLHERVPPNDGGLALGQATIVARAGSGDQPCRLQPARGSRDR
ncbi:MAG: carbamoyltransferase HypF, partial [Planctomycetota bacterium]|nr:carbamoyltransferase HypF [Planctomycetota bacterium]